MVKPLITIVGSANIDLTFRTTHLPKPGETAFGIDFFRGFGGKGANQAVAAARMGGRVAFVGKVGNDDHGQAIREQLRREEIDLSYLGIDLQRPTGVAAILVDEAGENAIVGVPGANLGLTPDDIIASREILERSRIVLAPCETMIETLTEVFAIAHAAGAYCILNPAPARELPDDLLRNVDLIVPNESELETLVGRSLGPIAEFELAANELRKLGPKHVIVTLGSKGAALIGPEGVKHIAPVIVQAIDTSGAGDAYCGALAAFLAEGLDLETAAMNANRAAAISVARFGTQNSFATREELTSANGDG